MTQEEQQPAGQEELQPPKRSVCLQGKLFTAMLPRCTSGSQRQHHRYSEDLLPKHKSSFAGNLQKKAHMTVTM